MITLTVITFSHHFRLFTVVYWWTNLPKNPFRVLKVWQPCRVRTGYPPPKLSSWTRGVNFTPTIPKSSTGLHHDIYFFLVVKQSSFFQVLSSIKMKLIPERWWSRIWRLEDLHQVRMNQFSTCKNLLSWSIYFKIRIANFITNKKKPMNK